ncbi:transcriptional regulator, LysR family [Bradyrhizobium erythrophlei]|nr:transcriptional regulator, LysR family [Bradyrhizobium erythrophlei]
MRFYCLLFLFYVIGDGAGIRISWTHCTGTWTIAGMDWRDWELFCEVVQHGGFSAAARVLGHPKSSLSAAVQRLESNLGLRLIERTTRHLRLTDAGQTIYQRVRPLFTALHDTHGEALAMSSAIAGTLRIKAPYEFGAHHAGPVACELMGRYPDLVIRIDVEHEFVSPVAENYDIVFAMLEAPLPSTGIVIRRVSSLERGLFAAPALLERLGEPRTLEDLARFPLLIGPSDTPWALTTPAGASQQLAVSSARLVSSNADIRLQAALAGHGVLRVTASYTKAAVAAGLLRRLLPDHVCEPLNVHALLPARQFVPAKVRCFLDALEAQERGGAAAQIEA